MRPVNVRATIVILCLGTLWLLYNQLNLIERWALRRRHRRAAANVTQTKNEVLEVFRTNATQRKKEMLEVFRKNAKQTKNEVLAASKTNVKQTKNEVLDVFRTNATQTKKEMLEVFRKNAKQTKNEVLAASKINVKQTKNEVLDVFRTNATQTKNKVLPVSKTNGTQTTNEVLAVSKTNVTQTKKEVLEIPTTIKGTADFTNKSLMVLFSSWAHSHEKERVHKTLTRLWASWPFIKPLVFTSDEIVRQKANASGWLTQPETHAHKECMGPPILSPMFIQAQKVHAAFYYGFANSDIVFGNGLADTLLYMHYHNAWKSRPVMVVGRRYNYDYYLHPKLSIVSPSNVTKLTADGKLVIRSTDYFFTNNIFPWDRVPEVTIGRPYVVRAVIGWALKQKITVIDATRTIEAVHLTTKDGIFASWHKDGVMCNERILMQHNWKIPTNQGHCECARLETFRLNGRIRIKRRPQNNMICK